MHSSPRLRRGTVVRGALALSRGRGIVYWVLLRPRGDAFYGLAADAVRVLASFMMNPFRSILSCLLIPASLCAASDEVISQKEVDELTVKSQDGRVTLKIAIERIDTEKLRFEEDANGHLAKTFLGDELMPDHAVFNVPTIVRGFVLEVDGLPIPVKDELWKDLTGFNLSIPIADERAKAAHMEVLMTMAWEDARAIPQIVVSDADDNYMIFWERGADCDQTHTVRWIISKDGSIILRHLEIPPHHC